MKPWPTSTSEISLDRFKSAACTLLSAERLTTIGDVREGRPRDRQGQPQCTREPKSTTDGVSFTLTISNGVNDYYEATGIAGYPAANFDGTKAENGHCGTAIALGKASLLLVQITVRGQDSPNYKTPCAESERISTVTVEGLK